MVQNTLNTLGLNSGSYPVLLQNVNLGEFTASALDLDIGLSIPPVVPLPIRAGLGRTQIYDGNRIADTVIPAIDFWVNDVISVAMSTNVKFDSVAQQNIANLISQVAQGVPDLQIMIHMKAPITLFGMTLYSGKPRSLTPGLSLYKNLDIGNVQTSLENTINLMKRIGDSFAPQSFLATGDLLKSQFSASDVISVVRSLSVVWSDLVVEMKDEGIDAKLVFDLENGSPFSVASIPGTDLYLELQGIPIAHVSTKSITLAKGMQKMSLQISVVFINDILKPDNFAKAINDASLSYSSTNDFSLQVVGPVNIPGADFVTTVTKDLRFEISLKDILSLMSGSISDIFNLSGVQSILGNSSIGIDVGTAQITIPLNLVLPNFIPIPRHFNFPYTTSLDLVGSSSKLIHTVIAPFLMSRNDNAILLNTSIAILPVNTKLAAQELANSLNPILAFKPTAGLIGFSNLAFALTNSTRTFKWTQALFGGQNVTIHLPPINKDALINYVSESDLGLSSAISNMFSVKEMSISQLDTKPGFGLDGKIQVAYPSSHPQVSVALGFFGVDLTLESSMLASFELPSGLQLSPVNDQPAIQASFSFDKDPNLLDKIQKAANFFKGDVSQSYLGVAGLKFGSSSSNHFVTFSLIAIDFSLETVEKVVPAVGVDTFANLLPDGLVTINSADLAMNSANDISLSVGALINNPTSFSLSLGSIALDLQLSSQTVLSFIISSIKVDAGSTQLQLKVKTNLRNSIDGSASKVSSILKRGSSSLILPIGVTGLVLSNGNGVIDQFSKVSLEYPLGKILDTMSKFSSRATKVIDFSPIIPSLDTIKTKINPVVKYLKVDSQTSSTLYLGIDMDYRNVVPVSIKIPFAAAEISINGAAAFDVRISGIQIDRNSGTIRPRISLLFIRDGAAASNLAKFVDQLFIGDLKTSIEVSKVYFGTSDVNKNDILSESSLDLTSLANSISAPLSGILSEFGSSLHSIEKRGISLSFPGNVGVDLNNIGLSFAEPNTISTALDASLTLPFSVDMNIPYFSARVYLDDAAFTDISFALFATGTSPRVNTIFRLSFHNSDSLADKFASIADVITVGGSSSTKLKVDHLVMGASPSNFIDSFSLISVSAPTDSALKYLHTKLGEGASSISLKDTIQSLEETKIGVESGKSLKIQMLVGFKNLYPVSITGLGYAGLELGLDDVMITSVDVSDISLATGTSKIPLSAKAHFPSNPSIQSKVGIFAENLQSNIGHTSQKLSISGLTFGSGKDSALTFLSKVVLKISSSIITSDSVDYIKSMLIPKIPSVKDVMLNSLSLSLSPAKIIDISLDGSINSNLSLSIDIPYVQLETALDSITSFDVSVSGIKLDGSRILGLGVSVGVHDNDELADKVKIIADCVVYGAPIPGTIGGSHMLFGVGVNDNIDTFSLVSVKFGLEGISESLRGSSFNSTAIFSKLGLSINSFGVKALPQQSLQAKLAGTFQNDFNFELKGMGLFSIGLGIDSLTIMSVDGGISDISNGANSLNINSYCHFPSDPAIKTKVGSFAKDLSNNGLGHSNANISFSALLFGTSKETAFRFLSKAAISIRLSSILSSSLVDPVFKSLGLSSGIADSFSVQKLHIEGETSDASLLVDLGTTLKNIAIKVDMDIGFAGLNFKLDDNIVPSGVSGSTSNNQIAFSLLNKVEFSNDAGSQSAIAQLGSDFYNNRPLVGTVSATGVFFGANPSDTIDTFSLVTLSNSAAAFYSSLGLFNTSIVSFADLMIKEVDLDVYDSNTLIANWALSVATLKWDISIHFPFMKISTLLNNGEFMDLSFTSFLISKGVVQGGCLVHFPDDPIVNNILVSGVSDILFHRVTSKSTSITFQSLAFGPSDAGSIRTFSQISLPVLIDPYAARAGTYFDTAHPLELNDIQSKIVHGGVEVICHTTPLAFPMIIKLDHIEINIDWQIGGVGTVYQALQIKMDQIVFPVFHAFATPNLDPATGALEPLTDFVLTMFTFKEFSGNARFGELIMVGSNGVKFKTFQHCLFNAPSTLYIPIPLYVDLFPYQLPLSVSISVRNPSPLHLDLGQAEISVLDSGGTSVVYANSTGDVIALNVNEGANPTPPKLPPQLCSLYAELDLGGLIGSIPSLLINLIRRRSLDYKVKVIFRRDGREVDWIGIVTQYMLSHGLTEKLLPLVGTIIGNVKITIGDPPSNNLLGRVEKWMLGSVLSNGTKAPISQHFPMVGQVLDPYQASLPNGIIITGH